MPTPPCGMTRTTRPCRPPLSSHSPLLGDAQQTRHVGGFGDSSAVVVRSRAAGAL
jgi:hypothetical protein